MLKIRPKKILALAIACILLSFVFVLASIALSRHWILHVSEGRTYSDVQALPTNRVGVVLGCSRELANGRSNLFFKYRMQAAVEAFRHGRVEYIIVSGDNHTRSYDEPSEMKAVLVERGVPKERIYCDYAGFRTLDSVVRAKEVFQESSITIISQEFHNQRAIFIGSKRGLDVIGYNARDVRSRSGLRTRCREQLARVKAVIDIVVLRKRPRFLGDPIHIGTDSTRGSGGDLAVHDTP